MLFCMTSLPTGEPGFLTWQLRAPRKRSGSGQVSERLKVGTDTASLPLNSIDQVLANIFSRRLDSKYSGLGRPRRFCDNHSILPL